MVFKTPGKSCIKLSIAKLALGQNVHSIPVKSSSQTLWFARDAFSTIVLNSFIEFILLVFICEKTIEKKQNIINDFLIISLSYYVY